MITTKDERPKLLMTEYMLITFGCAGVIALSCLVVHFWPNR